MIKSENVASSSDPLPCPHCAGTDIRFDCHRDYRSPTGEIWSMCCCTCGATFPNRYREQLLVEAWNRRAALTAPDTAGYKLVPIEPTEAMIKAGCENNPTMWSDDTDNEFAMDVAIDVYAAMIRAAHPADED